MVTVLIVLRDARFISFQAGGWREAIDRTIRNADRVERIERVFMHEPGNTDRCEEHTIESLRRDVAMGNVPR